LAREEGVLNWSWPLAKMILVAAITAGHLTGCGGADLHICEHPYPSYIQSFFPHKTEQNVPY